MSETMRILAAGQMVPVAEIDLRRGPWDVVQVHQDGSATVRVGLRRRDDGRVTPVVSSQRPLGKVDHEIRYVRGPLNRRYRCTACPWEGSALHLQPVIVDRP